MGGSDRHRAGGGPVVYKVADPSWRGSCTLLALIMPVLHSWLQGMAVQRLRAREACLSCGGARPKGRGQRSLEPPLTAYEGLIIPHRVKATPSNTVRKLMVW